MYKSKYDGWLELVIGAALILISLAILLSIKSYECSSYGELTERETRFFITNGCFIEYDGKFIPRSEFERRLIGK